MPMWTFSLEGGPRRVNHAAVAIGDRIFSFSGYCTGDDFTVVKPMDIHVFNTLSLAWREVKCHPDVPVDDIPYQRYGHSAVAYDDCVYLWGGRNDKNGSSSILYCFNTATGVWHRPCVSGLVPYGRDGHTACLHHHIMYIFGGYEEEWDRFSNEIYALDLTTFAWSHIKPIGGVRPARWRDFHTATMIGPRMYVFGGRSDHGGDIFTFNEIYCDEMSIFDTRTNEWSRPTVTCKPLGRRSHSAFYYEGELYIFGGFHGIQEKHYNTVHAFNPETLSWREVHMSGVGPCPRRRQCCCLIGSRVYLFGGTGPGQNDDFIVVPHPNDPGAANHDDLIDYSDLHILDFFPSLKTRCMMSVLSHKLDTKLLPVHIRRELTAIATNSSKNRSENPNG